MKPGTSLRCLISGRFFTVVKKRKPKNGYLGGVRMVHLKAEHMEMSIRVDLLMDYFELYEKAPSWKELTDQNIEQRRPLRERMMNE